VRKKLAALCCAVTYVCLLSGHVASAAPGTSAKKLYWLIPDGLRADPKLFDVFKWAQEGKLPNIKKMMDHGSYGYSIPVFPSHTPVNFATLLTGAYPERHGVADGPMHIEGRPLSRVAIGGFSSVAKRVPPIWVNLEKLGKRVALLSVPGSTPPELADGITVRGRWGGWGADVHAVNFQSRGDLPGGNQQPGASRLFYFGPPLTSQIDAKPASGWEEPPTSGSQPFEIEMGAWGRTIFGYVYDSVADHQTRYDRVAFSLDRRMIFADIGRGEWTAWQAVELSWQGRSVPSAVRIKLIRLSTDASKGRPIFRVRCLYSNINLYITEPPAVAEALAERVGPMVDFADNFPPQLIHDPGDRETFLEEADMSFVWHRRAAEFMLQQYDPDVFIQDVYTPNQMLTSRWWLGYIDPASERYGEVTDGQRKQLWGEVFDAYRKIDDILGEYLRAADDETLVVLSSDHGAIPLNRWVRLNNLFAREGLLTYHLDPGTGEVKIDWARSQVVYLKMAHVYIHPAGLGGDWKRATGPEYQTLRNRVVELLEALETEDHKKPVAAVVKWEDVRERWHLPEDRVGDLVIANAPGFGWSEEMNAELEVFSRPLPSGYKQAVLAQENEGMWTPFVVMGPGVKRNHPLPRPVQAVDQYPTILSLMGIEIPSFVEGQVAAIGAGR